MARDIRHELWPYFNRIMEILIKKIDKRSDQKLDAVFGAISLLLKHLENQAVPYANEIYK